MKLREEVHNKVLLLRSLEATILQPKFERLWTDSSKRQKDEVFEIIKAESKRRLNAWIRNHPSIDLGEKSLRQLRDIGCRLGVQNYSRLTKAELIKAIQDKEMDYGLQQGRETREDEDNAGRDGSDVDGSSD